MGVGYGRCYRIRAGCGRAGREQDVLRIDYPAVGDIIVLTERCQDAGLLRVEGLGVSARKDP
jgi:hypothetical protein